MITIRQELEKDYRENETLIREAFWNVYRPGCVEHFILHNLRSTPNFVPDLCYVMEQDGQLIASIVYSMGSLQLNNGKSMPMLSFGPLAVLPQYQRCGWGSAMVKYTLDFARKRGYPAVVICGSPDYYSRFGFLPASTYGIHHECVERSDSAPFFMIKVFNEEMIGALQGVYYEPKCFTEINQEQLERYDSAFTPKVKMKKEGQLV
ncbi:MAG: N-acetyltransferase [Clostridia bacterium]|nr:N-acetyltransferase [Clostridia bacterium]